MQTRIMRSVRYCVAWSDGKVKHLRIQQARLSQPRHARHSFIGGNNLHWKNRHNKGVIHPLLKNATSLPSSVVRIDVGVTILESICKSSTRFISIKSTLSLRLGNSGNTSSMSVKISNRRLRIITSTCSSINFIIGYNIKSGLVNGLRLERSFEIHYGKRTFVSGNIGHIWNRDWNSSNINRTTTSGVVYFGNGSSGFTGLPEFDPKSIGSTVSTSSGKSGTSGKSLCIMQTNDVKQLLFFVHVDFTRPFRSGADGLNPGLISVKSWGSFASVKSRLLSNRAGVCGKPSVDSLDLEFSYKNSMTCSSCPDSGWNGCTGPSVFSWLWRVVNVTFGVIGYFIKRFAGSKESIEHEITMPFDLYVGVFGPGKIGMPKWKNKTSCCVEN